MNSRRGVLGWLGKGAVLNLMLSLRLWAASQPSTEIRLEVDAREISRHLIHAREEIPVKPGPLALWYPKWIPGTHSPAGPVQNLGGLYLEKPDGQRIPWRRDEGEVYRIECTVPDGTDRLIVRLDYICNQSSVNSEGVDSFGNAQLGVVDWNTCLLYPESGSIDEVSASVRLLFPAGWKYGTSLRAAREEPGVVEFAAETLRDVVDSPLIMGENFRTIDFKSKNFPPVYMHLVSESLQAIQLEAGLIGHYSNLVNEAAALYGGAHFDSYHFLVTCSDQIGVVGLEHLSSSMDGVREQVMIDEKKREGSGTATLLPHEFSHSWCGKHRRPAGMLTSSFHSPERTGLLWVYEGLTQYLGDLLAVRSGLISTTNYIASTAACIEYLQQHQGRRWRPLEDTAIANHILRASSSNWAGLRRNQDYYDEGALLWLEADAIIRQKSDGRKSLDDFCRKFMGAERKDKIVPYDRSEVVRTLQGLADYDWEKFIHERVDVTQEALPLTVVERCGYRLQYATKPSALVRNLEETYKFITLASSLGLVLLEDGTIGDVVSLSPADKAKLAPGMKVEGVNGRKFSRERLLDAVADSVTRRQVEFLVMQGDTYRTLVVAYADGPKYLELVRDPGKPDLLMTIAKPIAP